MARVLFLQKIWTENLGPMYLSSYLKQHDHDTHLIIVNNQSLLSDIKHYNPDIIAFSVTTGSHHWALECAKRLKKEFEIPLIMGGAHATYYPEVLNRSELDMICRGEGEKSFLELANCLDENKDFSSIPNLWIKKNGQIKKNELGLLIENLDTIPPPDRDLYYRYEYLKENENKAFISGRGCPFSCTYCSIAGLRQMYQGKGQFVRFHSPERVVDEILHVKHRYGLKSIIFQDDTFIVGGDRLFKLLDLYRKEVRMPFVCHIRADLVTEEIAGRLKEAGCHSVDFGIESGNEELREKILGKPITNERIIESARILRQAKIKFRTTNMMGLPGETLDNAFETIHLNQIIQTHYPSASVYQPYPRTALGDSVIKQGLVDTSFSVDNIGSTFLRTSVLNIQDRDQFINLQKLFWPAVRFPWLFPLIKQMIRFRPNQFFEFLFLTFYAMNYMLSEKVSIRRVMNLGIHTVKDVFFGQSKNEIEIV